MVDPILGESDARHGFGDAWVITNAVGDIDDISADAARLLNLSQRGARGRNLATFFIEDRPRLLAQLLRAAEGAMLEHTATLQPRDRRPVGVRVHISAVPVKPGDRISLRWVISRDSR
jgi:PAS domain-containing protein